MVTVKRRKMCLLKITFIAILMPIIPCFLQDDKLHLPYRIEEGFQIAKHVFAAYDTIFNFCLSTSMPNKRFIADNLHSYINEFSKTTVGQAPQFTTNRKFFANMISTAAFKTMLMKDIDTLHKNVLEKLKFCDESVITQDTLMQFYDREVDQTKL